jgi:hypothetical protein
MAKRKRKSAAADARQVTEARRDRVPRLGAKLFAKVRRLARRRPFTIAAALVALHIGLALLTFEPRPHTGGDNGAYITLGRSLLEHGTYTELWDPAEAPHTKYPPVFPAVLAVAMALGLHPWVPLKLVVLGFSAAAVAFGFLWMRARRRPGLALAVGFTLAIAPGILREGRWILSDVPFWCFTIAALWAYERLRPDDWPRFAIAAAATVLAYFTRSAGLPLVLAALAWLAWRRHWAQAAALAVVTGVPAALWMLRSRAHGPAGYVSEFWFVDPYLPMLGTIGPVDFFQRVLENTIKYISIHMPVLLTGSTGSAVVLVSILIAGLAGYGWLLRVRRARVADLFLPLYMGLILIWPAIWSGERFLLPVLPVLLFYAGEALFRLLQRRAPRHDFAVAAGAVALLLLLAAPGLVRGVQTGFECTSRYLEGERFPCLGSPYYDDFFELSELSGRILPFDAVVLNRKPRLFHVLSDGLQSVNYPMSEDPAAFFATADSVGARYVLFDRLDAVSEIYLLPLLTQRPAAFCLMLIRQETSTAIFGIMPNGASVPPLSAGAGRRGDVSFAFCGTEYWRGEAQRRMYGGT